MVDYYDYVLGLVPLALLGVTGVLSAAGVDTFVALPVGATTAGLVVGHALFVNGPVDRPSDADVLTQSSTGQTPMHAD